MGNKAQRRSCWLALLACLPALALDGCGILSFDVSNDISPQTIAGSPLGALLPASLFSIPMNVNISTETAKRGTGPADLLGAVAVLARVPTSQAFPPSP